MDVHIQYNPFNQLSLFTIHQQFLLIYVYISHRNLNFGSYDVLGYHNGNFLHVESFN